MDDRKDWLAMTRHERRGALALVLLAVMVIVAVWLLRTRTHRLTPVEQLQMRQLELVADTLQQAADSAKHVTHKKREARGKKREARGKKKETRGKAGSKVVPHRMEPVPQF